MTSANILIVEDEKKIVELLRDYLEKAQYKVSSLERGDEAVSHVKKSAPDLILLDIMLPGMDGMEVCREIRRFSSVPIIMLTAKVEEVDRLIGLELGADDYICKPFSPREVVARVKAVLRRANTGPIMEKMVVGPFMLDDKTHQVAVNGESLELTPSEFSLLRVLMAHPTRVFSRNELLNQVQGYDFEGYDRTIDTHIKNLRKKIAQKLPNQDVITTVYGIGYKFTV
ncbi:response regulator [Desulforhabdus amnigena]|uniref:Phosphate regulon transcriptional regulatory protein PhoB n=1 Tax=Desulforhabdus amnigena TaxID=40218 RepID=A0A9W6FRG0_9BACT|nr:response regulator [Desulforhabdus amnigena]NLJ27295.1 response regulator [Deltaproteobacteria bacterium]GLI32943.1 DNA-binding response regulator [Desulforhabdus amnigena]